MEDNKNDKVAGELMELGFSKYEAKIYLSLLRKSPATAYEAGKASGVPTSKVYEVLKKLLRKGLISLIDEGRTKKYVPMEPDEFLGKYKSRTEKVIESLKASLWAVGGRREASYIWNIDQYEYLIEKAARMIESARVSVLVSAWKEEFSALQESLTAALQKEVNIAVVHFGFPELKIGQIYRHPIEDTIYREKGGRGLVLVVDSREVLMGTVSEEGSVDGAWSTNRGFVVMAEDYIRHDIYVMKMVRHFGVLLRRSFGKSYEKLRDIFKDEVIT